MPASIRAAVLRSLGEIQTFGVTGLLPGRTRLSGWNHEFSTFAPKRWFSVRQDDGAVIHGFWKPDFDKVFFIYAVKEIEGGTLRGADKLFFLSSPSGFDPPPDMAEYQAIDREWIDEQSQNPFTAKADDNLNAVAQANATLASYLEEACCYRSTDDIFEYAEIAKRHGTKPPWDYLHSKERVEWYQFDAASRAKHGHKDLQYFIDGFLKQQHTLLFVHFKDEQDVLSQAQSEFLNMLAFYIHDDYKTLNIKIMTVLTRDAQGANSYEKEFHEYFSNNMLGQAKSRYRGDPASFVMVLGNPFKDAFAHQTAFVRRQGTRLLDFDLFHGCRGELAEKPRCNFAADKLFRSNLRQTMHEIECCAGLIGNLVTTNPKDYRGLPKNYVEDALWRLEQNAVVIKVHTEENYVARTAIRLCGHLKSSGCPYVEAVVADGPKDIIEVHDESNTYSEFSLNDGGFSDTDGGDGLFWAVERAMRSKYTVHSLNGASPFLIKRDSGKDAGRGEKTPEIFSSTRKPLH